MTTIESIQLEIHIAKTELSISQRLICKDEIEKIHNQSTQEYFLNKLEELESSLKMAIKQLS